MSRRVVITAVGVISALGSDLNQIAHCFKQGGVKFERPVFNEDVVTCPVRGFDVKKHTGRFKYLRYLNRGAAFAVAAAADTVNRAELTPTQLRNTGLFVGAGPNLDISGDGPGITLDRMDEEKLAALWILQFLPNTAASAIAQLTGLRGDNLTVGTACSASLQALGEAFRKIKDGYLDRAVAGGGDSRLSPGGILAYTKAQALYSGPGNPAASSRPFDEGRNGFVPGEGGAFFLLEEAHQALDRGAEIIAEVAGYGAAIDGHTMTAPEPDGRWAETAVRTALDEAGLSAGQVDAVSAHGTSTPLNDAMEAEMIHRVFGNQGPRVTALKSWIGHLASACGAVELALCLTALKQGMLPQIRNLNSPCHPGVKFVRRTFFGQLHTILLENFGFGGQNAALVIRTWNP